MRVLIVEDDAVYGPALERALRRADAELVPTLTTTVEHAMADEETYDAAVVDLSLPDGSGLDVVQHLVARGCAVLVLTGHGSIPAAVQCMQLGAADFLTKPVSTAEIGDAIAKALADEPRAAVEPSSERLDDVERAHILAVLEDCGGNISQAARRLGLYRRTLQRKLQKL